MSVGLKNKDKHPPEYSLGDSLSPPLKNLMVGYPRTPYSWASSVSSVASTLPRRTSDPSAFSMPAALAYSGARALQWPHHGASAGATGGKWVRCIHSRASLCCGWLNLTAEAYHFKWKINPSRQSQFHPSTNLIYREKITAMSHLVHSRLKQHLYIFLFILNTWTSMKSTSAYSCHRNSI